jgi:choline dehydrogenase-like flavoprotein
VVTRDLLVRGTTNLHVLSTGVFPSAGTANPTFSLLCFGEALATRLIDEVGHA